MRRIVGTIALLLLLPSVFAQSFVVSPQAIVVNPKPTFGVEVWFDKGGSAPVYQIGEDISINVKVDERSYVYLFDVRPNGDITQIFPNRYDSDNFLRAGETRTFPPSSARYVFSIAPPRGLSKVIAIASRTELNTRELARFQRENDIFAQSNIGEQGFINSFAIVVRPIQQQDWVTDTALYYVGNSPAEPAFGSVRFSSEPTGATVYLDGEFVGYTPMTFGTTPGSKRVRVQLDGYEDYTTTINIRPGQTEQVNASLRQVARTGLVRFESSPSGADVYVGGRYVGTTPTNAIEFEQGRYDARFDLPGYEQASTSFDVRAGDSRTVSMRMAQTRATMVIEGNVGGARVFVNGREVGALASGSGRYTVADIDPGSYEVVVIAPGYRTHVETVRVRAGETTNVRFRQDRY